MPAFISLYYKDGCASGLRRGRKFERAGGAPLPPFRVSVHSNRVKVLCFDTDLQVLITKGVSEAAGRAKSLGRRTNFMANDSTEGLPCKVTVLGNTAEMWARRERWGIGLLHCADRVEQQRRTARVQCTLGRTICNLQTRRSRRSYPHVVRRKAVALRAGQRYVARTAPDRAAAFTEPSAAPGVAGFLRPLSSLDRPGAVAKRSEAAAWHFQCLPFWRRASPSSCEEWAVVYTEHRA